MNKQSILILDDEIGFRDEIGDFLTSEGYNVLLAGLPSEALKLLKKNKVDIGLFDIRLPEMDGIALLSEVKKKHPYLEIIIMTGFGDMPTVIKAMRSGASDFLNKPFKLHEITETLNRISKYHPVHNYQQIKNNKDQSIQLDNFNAVGTSPGIQKVFKQLNQVAKTDDATVLFTGDSGTGKELMARILHTVSKRNNYPFVAVNCSTIPSELFENEFFGHVRGSFTDAKADQKGFFEAADKGTLFLDEIGDMKLNMQAKLLRVIEDKFISPIGSTKTKKIDVRILAATNQNLKLMVGKKTFREDLYHRINMFNIQLPPLKEHKEDIPDLVNHFINMYSEKLSKPVHQIDKRIIPRLMEYHFPGNVRELKNMIERAIILMEGDQLKLSSFTNLDILINEKNYGDASVGESLSLPQVERDCIVKALQKEKFNKSATARLLNISRQALDRKIKKYKIELG
jgi:DNA-binding NtrC family response regulator